MNSFKNYFNNLEKKHKMMLYASVLLLCFMIFNQFVPSLMQEQEDLNTNISAMQMKILNNSTARLQSQLKKSKNQLLKSQAKLEESKEKINYLIGNLYQVKFAFFREVELAKSLDLVLKESLKRNVQIDFIKNLDEEVENLSELISYKKSMHIEGKANYKDTLKFIAFVENFELLSKVKSISIEEIEDENRVHFSLKIDFYGVGL